ncbi:MULTISPECIES: lipopolysaccharide biosynthesis protein [Flavobacteriaceae]|uniref:lipopolysaccharide biosynthesis protein n=1 Tax=Flavobacteriaceae TaxID=49546 RepID=UPI001490AF5B|nr:MULTISPECIES: lipopolysaccharide biosynthesis protein [Allomuricauda]MDC6366863.1 lipopolysaccharide biosynthesis protein [Muricauda sp. AC10]
MSLGNKILTGAFWSLIERVSTQIIQSILGIVLARLLSPTDYGLIGLLTVFIVISQVFIDSGFTKALIQKQNRTQSDIYTVFVFNILISVTCYLVLWLASPFIADFYEIPQLKILLRVLSISLMLNSLFAVPMTLVTINLNFKLLAKVNLITVTISGLVAIYLAYTGFGVWALVYQTLLKSLFTVLLLWFLVKWTPKFQFSKSSFKELFSYGSKLLAGSLLNTGANNISALLIGKVISTKQLGYYTQGTQFTDLVFKTINSIVNKVILPTLSKIQDQKEALVKYSKNILKTATLFTTPIFFILIVIAEPFIKVLLTEKWLPAVPILQIFAVARLITIICGINVNLLYVLGRTDITLKQQYIKIPIRLIFIIAAIKFGIVYVALGELLATTIHYFIDSYYPGKIMNYGTKDQIKDMAPVMLLNLCLMLLSFILMYYIPLDWLKLIATPIFYGVMCLIGMHFLKIPEYLALVKKTKEMIKRKKT